MTTGNSPREIPFLARTVPSLLERQASLHGKRPLLAFDSCERSFVELRDAVAARAGTLAACGVEPGDRVAIMCANGPEFLELWLASGWLGAIAVPLNTAFRGGQLDHVLRNSAPRVLAVDAELIPNLDAIEAPPLSLERVWVVGDTQAAGEWRSLPFEGLPELASPVEPHSVRPGDAFTILYTSGTTGVSKGVCSPHAQLYWWGTITGEQLGVSRDDCLYTILPMFHIGPLNTFYQGLLYGAFVKIGKRFSASGFWKQAIAEDATVTYLLGAMAQMLLKQPSRPEERAHRVRVALAPGTTAEPLHDFQQRFGVELVEAWGSTETNYVIGAPAGHQRPGAMGRVLNGFDARVVDENDNEVADGTYGELVVRHSEPFSVSTGYYGMPEATVATWRNLWFHSGDRVVRDEDGYFRFVDRLKEVIRRRGENISSFEVERVLSSHPDVGAVAVIPVPSELQDDEVMACVVLRAGARLRPEELIRYCEGRLAYFAIPRYVDFLPELPLTENGKVRKYVLRERGVSPTTWDREAPVAALGR